MLSKRSPHEGEGRSLVSPSPRPSPSREREDLLDWHRKTGDPDVTYLVHGEEEAMAALEKRLRNTEVRMPRLGDGFPLR